MSIKDLFNQTLLRRLHRYAERKSYPYHDKHASILINPEDLVQEVICQVLSNERPWNKENCPDLFSHLAGCIKSNIYNHSHKKMFMIIDGNIEIETLGDIVLGTLVEIYLEEDEFLSYVMRKAPDLYKFAETVIKAEISKPKELAVFFNTDVNDINNKKERLKRLFNKHNRGD